MGLEYDFLAFVMLLLTFVTTLIILVIVLRLVNTMGVMYMWHNKDDADGVKLWYFPRGLEDSMGLLARNIEKMKEAIKAQTNLLMYLRSRDDRAGNSGG